MGKKDQKQHKREKKYTKGEQKQNNTNRTDASMCRTNFMAMVFVDGPVIMSSVKYSGHRRGYELVGNLVWKVWDNWVTLGVLYYKSSMHKGYILTSSLFNSALNSFKFSPLLQFKS